MKGQHQRVTVTKVKNLLAKQGIGTKQIEIITNSLRGGAKRLGAIRLKRAVVAKIGDALLQDGKCGLFITKTNRVIVVSGEHVTFSHFRAGEKALRHHENETQHEEVAS